MRVAKSPDARTCRRTLRENLGTRRVPKVSNVRFPDADPIVGALHVGKLEYNTDVLLVNPPAPDGEHLDPHPAPRGPSQP